MARRQNTFRIDFANAPKKPSYEELHLFVANELGLQYHEVKRIQCSRISGCAFVKVANLELAHKVCEEHDEKHVLEIDGKAYTVRIRMEDGAVEVRLFDLSEDITEQQINDYLCAYGDILSVREHMWDDKYHYKKIPSGIWIARMIVKQNIPSTINIDGELTYVTYYGQNQTCRHCGEYVHNGASCVQNKKLLIQKMAADNSLPNSYANVAKQSPKVIGPAQSKLSAGSGRKPSASSGSKPPASTGNKPNKPDQQLPKPLNQQVSSISKAVFKKPQEPKQKQQHSQQPQSQQQEPQQQQQQQQQEQDQQQQEQEQQPPQRQPQPQSQQQQQQQQPQRQPQQHLRSRLNKNNDGGETDDSVSSNNSRRSRRQHEKKPRYDDIDISQDEDMTL